MSKKEEKGWMALQQGRSYMKCKLPYFYTTLIGMVPVHVPNIEAMVVTDSMVLVVDMDWLPSIPVEQIGGMLANCTMRVLKDIKRLRAMPDQDIAEYAFDIPLNDDIKAAGIPLPDWAVYSSTHKFPPGLTGEKYYALCEEKGIVPPKRVTAFNLNQFTDLEKLEKELGRTPSDITHFRRQGLKELKDYIAARGPGYGSVPGSFRELLEFDGTEEAVVPWQSVTSSNVGRSCGRITHGHSDYSLRRPSKRSYTLGMLRPGLIGYEPNVCYIEDSSGSMGPEQLKANRVEVGKCMRQLGFTNVWFLQADVVVRGAPKMITVNDLMTLPVLGRGGTDFTMAIDAALKLKPRPDLIIYSTDGDGRAPEFQPRNTEFIWLLAPGPWTRSPCNWGTQILTTNDPSEKKKYTLIR